MTGAKSGADPFTAVVPQAPGLSIRLMPPAFPRHIMQAAMANEKLDDETKQYISDRTQTAAECRYKDAEACERCTMMCSGKRIRDFIEAAQGDRLWSAFLSEREGIVRDNAAWQLQGAEGV